MNLKIERAFRDKITGERYEAGAVVNFETKRAEEILADARKLASEVKEKKTRSRKK